MSLEAIEGLVGSDTFISILNLLAKATTEDDERITSLFAANFDTNFLTAKEFTKILISLGCACGKYKISLVCFVLPILTFFPLYIPLCSLSV